MKSKAFIAFIAILMAVTTGNVVLAQLRFNDGTEQGTAFTGRSAVPVGKAFAVSLITPNNRSPLPIGTTVPAGQELVVLQVSIVGTQADTSSNRLAYCLESRLPNLRGAHLSTTG